MGTDTEKAKLCMNKIVNNLKNCYNSYEKRVNTVVSNLSKSEVAEIKEFLIECLVRIELAANLAFNSTPKDRELVNEVTRASTLITRSNKRFKRLEEKAGPYWNISVKISKIIPQALKEAPEIAAKIKSSPEFELPEA